MDFWPMWSGITASVCLLLEPKPAQPMQKRHRVETQAGLKPERAPVQVLVDLCLKEDTLDQTLCYLLKKTKQRRSLLHLCCQKLRIFTMPRQSIRGILKVVQLNSIQDLEVNCTWKLDTLGRRWKLQLLDLGQNSYQNFWTTSSGITASVCSLLEPEPAQPMQKRRRKEAQAGLKLAWAPVQVLVDLCLKEDTLDQTLCYLLKKAKQRRSLLHLCCQKLRIFAMPMQSIRGILKVVQLESVQDLEVNCTWKLTTLGRFMLHLDWMGNLCWLLLWRIHVLLDTALNQEEHCVGGGHTHMSMTFPLEDPCLPIKKDLGLSGVNLTNLSLEPLQVLIERTSTTLQDLDLDECGIMDTQFSTLLPSLSHCS
ncbi:hypothetical protein E5288_WYG009445 [Bos mutus]|uniref:Uncharacterized protein n=1 Tax=Bos mutus TaxID=72004 RepID=A0A6B0SC13_9CETA|nr:hypothetical protein [Bos mutus]